MRPIAILLLLCLLAACAGCAQDGAGQTPGAAEPTANAPTQDGTGQTPGAAERYTLSAENMRACVMRLNGRELRLSGDAELPDLTPVREEAGTVELAPGTCTFLVLSR